MGERPAVFHARQGASFGPPISTVGMRITLELPEDAAGAGCATDAFGAAEATGAGAGPRIARAMIAPPTPATTSTEARRPT